MKMSSYENLLLAPDVLTAKTYWPKLHQVILQAYKPIRDDWPLPKAFQRLDPDTTKAGQQMREELGPDATIAVAFDGEDPIACAAVQKFKIIRQSDVDGTAPAAQQSVPESSLPQWEINLVTTFLAYRNRGIATRLVKALEEYIGAQHGRVQLMVRTVDEISGGYWRKLGFTAVDEYCITVPKGFSHVKDAPDELRLARDVFLWTGQKVVG
jgi:GNAT superfamily N-acetyltransferase